MFHQLTRYVFEQWLPQTTPADEGVETGATPPSRLTSSEPEDDWVLVEQPFGDSEGNSTSSSMSSLDLDDDGLLVVERSPDRVVVVAAPALLRPAMEESWFLTPPPCFISTGPVHMETSPLENLLIEHPSMSVYTHHRRFQLPEEETEAVLEEEEAVDAEGEAVVVVHRAPRGGRVHVLQQQERQGTKGKQAQKMQIQKACKSFKRGSLDRNNKAREVNSRNRRQRRGERSQGATRSHANNNRKC